MFQPNLTIRQKLRRTFHSMKRASLLLILFLCTTILCAGPARRGFFNKTMPDGTTLRVRLVGDEFRHAYQTEEGALWEENEDGSLVSFTWDDFNREHSANKILAKTGAYRMKDFPTTGTVHGVVILVSFTDLPFSVSNDSIHLLLSNRFNAEHYSEEITINEWSQAIGDTLRLSCTVPGSVRDYFHDQSFGKFRPTFDVIGPIRMDSTQAYYGGNGRGGAGSDVNVRQMVKEACQKVYDQGLSDFTDYDGDDDGFVDFVYIVYAGPDEAQYGGPNSIWAKAWNLSSPLTLGDMSISKFACSSELLLDTKAINGIGTFVHEFSHIVGLPDFYNVNDRDDFAVDYWSVMDYGMYAAEGFVPQGYTSFERYSLGWIPMQTLSEPDTIALSPTNEVPTGWRAFVNDEDTTSYFVFENIQRVECPNDSIWGNWYSHSPTYGLMISCVNYDASAWTSNHVNTDRNRHRYYIVPANNDYSFETVDKQLFGAENHAFGPETTPASITSFGNTMNKPLKGITREKGGPCRFNFNGYVDTSIRRELPAAEQEEAETPYYLNSSIRIVRKDGRYVKQLDKSGIFSH